MAERYREEHSEPNSGLDFRIVIMTWLAFYRGYLLFMRLRKRIGVKGLKGDMEQIVSLTHTPRKHKVHPVTRPLQLEVGYFSERVVSA